jgi:hypothetical protein
VVVSGLSTSTGSSGSTTTNVAQIEQQIANLEKQVTLENQSKTDDAKTKLAKVELLQM